MHILLVSHGKLCEGVLDAFSMLVSGCKNISALSLTESGVGDFRVRLESRSPSSRPKGTFSSWQISREARRTTSHTHASSETPNTSASRLVSTSPWS